jgi:hypothetical protein
MRKLIGKGVDLSRMIFPLLLYKYYEFDLDAPFMPQYINNMKTLKKKLTDLAGA